MVKKRMTLKQLKMAVAKEKKKSGTISERQKLERQLKELRAGPGSKLIKRVGKGFVILSKKGAKATGKGIIAARKFAEESGAGEGLDVNFQGGILRGKKRVSKTRKKKIRQVSDGNDFFGGMGLTNI
jgi:hypothetical protein